MGWGYLRRYVVGVNYGGMGLGLIRRYGVEVN